MKIPAHLDNNIPGGLADGKQPKDYPAKQMRKGIKVEMEHTSDPEIAAEITMDHVEEDKKYYDKLEKMEAPTHLKAAGMGRKLMGNALSTALMGIPTMGAGALTALLTGGGSAVLPMGAMLAGQTIGRTLFEKPLAKITQWSRQPSLGDISKKLEDVLPEMGHGERKQLIKKFMTGMQAPAHLAGKA